MSKHYRVIVEPGGWRFDTNDSLPLLSSARHAGIVFPASCRNGTCRTCLCRMRSGKVRYNIAWPGLSMEEKKEGYILPCVAYAESDVVIEVPAATLLPA